MFIFSSFISAIYKAPDKMKILVKSGSVYKKNMKRQGTTLFIVYEHNFYQTFSFT